MIMLIGSITERVDLGVLRILVWLLLNGPRIMLSL